MTATSLNDIVKSVSTGLSTEGSVSLHDCNLNGINGGGSFASVVAYHKDLPDVVVKVVPEYDYFLIFANAILTGEIESIHFPEIYSITKVGKDYIVLMERLLTPTDCCEFHDQVERINCCEWDVEDPCSLRSARAIVEDLSKKTVNGTQINTDLYSTNFMERGDGTLVFIDPIWNASRSGGDCLEELD